MGLKRGGPIAVVTNLGLVGFDEVTKEMYLVKYYPGVSPESIIEHTGFPLDVSRAVESVPPSGQELRIFREKVDPQGLMG